jgi:hypothetical protein
MVMGPGLFVAQNAQAIGTVTTLSSSYGGYSVAWRHDDSYAIMTSGNNRIDKFDGSTFSTLSVSLPVTIYDSEWRPDNAYALLVGMDYGTNYATAYTFDGSTLTPTIAGFEPWGNPNYGVSWKPDGSYALISNVGYLLKFDPSTNTVSQVANIPYTMRDVEWNPNGQYAICVGQVVWKYDGSTLSVIEPSGTIAGLYRGVSFKSDGNGAMLITSTGELRYFDGSTISHVGDAGYGLWKIHYKPSSNFAIAVGENGHICEWDGTTIHDLPTDASSVGLTGLDWRSDGAYALATIDAPFTIKYTSEGTLSGSVVFDNWGYGSKEVANITVMAFNGGIPIAGTSVTMSSGGAGSFNPVSGTTDGTGLFKTAYTPPIVSSNTLVSISASLSKSGYISGSGQNTTTICPAIQVTWSISPTTFYLGPNVATCSIHAAIYGFPSISVDNADVQVVGGWGKWNPSLGKTDANGDFSSTYTTHRYVAGLEWHHIDVQKPSYEGDGGGILMHSIAPPITAPTLLSPADGFTTNILPTLEWDIDWGAWNYDVFIGRTPSVSDTDFYTGAYWIGGEFTNWTPRMPLPDGTYYWTVRAENGTLIWSPLAAPRSFKLQNGGIPSAPVLHSLSSPDTDGNFVVSWDAGSDDIGIKEYILQESQNPYFNSPWEYHVTGTSMILSNRQDGFYYYRIATIDTDNQQSFWNGPAYIEVRHAAAQAISLSLSQRSILVGDALQGSVVLSGSISPYPSERRDVLISILNPQGRQTSIREKTYSFNFAGYSHTYSPMIPGTYSVTAQLLDTSGTIVASTQPTSFTAFSGTGLTLFVDKANVIVDSDVMIEGDFAPSRTGSFIDLTITDPSGTISHNSTRLSRDGFHLNFIPDSVGRWSISATWPGDTYLPANTAGPIYLDVTGLPKLAIIIAGMSDITSEIDRGFVTETNYAYNILLRNGYTKDQIMYLAYTTNIDADGNGLYDDVDALSDTDHILTTSYLGGGSDPGNAFTWAKNRLDSSSDLIFYYMGHGLTNSFECQCLMADGKIGHCLFYDFSLRDRLNQINCRYSIIILNACYSGSFIDNLSHSNRIVITAAGDEEGVIIGFNDNTLPGISGGTYLTFGGRLFEKLGQGLSYRDAFIAAGGSADIRALYFAWGLLKNFGHWTQPYIDDNGDGVGSGITAFDRGIAIDGDTLANKIGLTFALDPLAPVTYLNSSFGENVSINCPVAEERATTIYAEIIFADNSSILNDTTGNGSYIRMSGVQMYRSYGINYSTFLNKTILNRSGTYFISIEWAGQDGSGGLIEFINLTVHPLLAPQGIISSPGDKQVMLSWARVPSADSYDIYRSFSSGINSTIIASTLANITTYLDKNVANGLTYYYHIIAVSGDEESEPSMEVSATPIPNIPPIVNFSFLPSTGNITTIFAFDASASSDFEDPVSALQVRWDWENDGIWDTAWSTTKTATHQYSTSGTMMIGLDVMDTQGATNITMRSITVQDVPPVAVFTVVPSIGNSSTDFTVDASSSYDLEDSIGVLQVRWDWENDGIWDTAWSTTKTSTHSYLTGGDYTIRLQVKDSSNLTGEAVLNVSVDDQSPTTIATLTGTIGDNGWYVSAVGIDLSSSDLKSGVDVTKYRIDGGSWLTYSGTLSVSTTGLHTIDFNSTDLAGNAETTKSVIFKIDMSTPTVSSSLSGTIGTNGWYASSVTVVLLASDPTSGISITKYNIDGGVWQTYFGSFSINTNGTHVINYYSIDLAGNNGSGSTNIKKDSTIPVTSSTVSGTIGGSNWYNSSVRITLTASDSPSGINWTKYSLDGGAWMLYIAPFDIIANGSHTLQFYSIDMAGNSESYSAISFKIDMLAPYTEISPSGTIGSGNWYMSSVTIVLTSSDNDTGIKNIMWRIDNGTWFSYSSPIAIGSQGLHSIEYYSQDKANNIETTRTFLFGIDKNPPSLIISLPSTKPTEGNITIYWNGTDTIGGIDHYEISIDGGAYAILASSTNNLTMNLSAGNHTISIRAVDTASNVVQKNVTLTVLKKSSPSSGGSSFSVPIVLLIPIFFGFVVIITLLTMIMIGNRNIKRQRSRGKNKT